jgi:hypothetical protein
MELKLFVNLRPLGLVQGILSVSFGGQSDTGTGFVLCPLVFPCQYNSANAPHSLRYHLGMGSGLLRGAIPQRHNRTA